jgi:flavin reductase (DIM6/NTAB) family NADH-FMN oxidoreductase RutF
MRLHPDTLSGGAPATTPPLSEQAEYRHALASFGTGVTVVTTRWQDCDWGMTCNSFSSVSLEPRLVLWFTRSGGFTVNILSHAQQHLARQFATGSLEQRFAGVPLERLSSQRVCLNGAVAWFECELHQLVEAGDHTIVLGRVVRYASQDTPALSFWRSSFDRFGANAKY